MSVIEATCAGFKAMADDTVRFSFDVEPRHAEAALRLFRVRGTAAALAALLPVAEQSGHEESPTRREPEPERLKGGMAAKWLALRCAEPAFQSWLAGNFPAAWMSVPGDGEAKVAANVIRAVCSVESRAQIDNDEAANERFQRLIRGPWQKFTVSRS